MPSLIATEALKGLPPLLRSQVAILGEDATTVTVRMPLWAYERWADQGSMDGSAWVPDDCDCDCEPVVEEALAEVRLGISNIICDLEQL